MERQAQYGKQNGSAEYSAFFGHDFFEHAGKAYPRERQNVVKEKLRHSHEVRALDKLQQTVNNAHDQTFAHAENVAVDEKRQHAGKRYAPAVVHRNFDETEDLDFDFFEYDELLKIIHVCQKSISNNDSDYFPYLVLFSLSSGLRLGEATGLQRKYFHDYVVNVRKELAKIKIFKDNKFDRYEYKLIPVKTKSSVRDVTMPTLFFDEIDRYINTVLKDIYKSNNVIFNENSLIFINSECGFIDQSNLRKKWIKLLNDLNIKYRKWHRLRAGFACLLFKEGVDIKTVQELLGHKDINTTINIYLKVFPESKKESVNNLNNLLLHETKVINM